MNGSTQSIYLALGCAAALTASACSRPSPSPSSPTQGVGTTSPAERAPETTGGSNTQQPGFGSDRGSQGTGQPGAMQQGEPSEARPGGSVGTGAGASPMGAQGGEAGRPGAMGGTSGAPSAINEREACDRLRSEAMLHMEPIEGGVIIVARPRQGVDLSKLRGSVQSIQQGIERGAPSSAATQCDLFSFARTGIVAIAETPDSIRLLVTTSDAARVPQLRRQANEFIRSSRGGAPKGAPEHGGETPQQPGTGTP